MLALKQAGSTLTLAGRRLPDGEPVSEPGDYGRDEYGAWQGMTPNGRIGSLAGHDVIEHEDGTITVSPSILVHPDQGGWERKGWHGYLERGIWREV